MSQFCRMYESILFLVKYTKAFNKVVKNRLLSVLADCGQNWQERLKTYSPIWKQPHNIYCTIRKKNRQLVLWRLLTTRLALSCVSNSVYQPMTPLVLTRQQWMAALYLFYRLSFVNFHIRISISNLNVQYNTIAVTAGNHYKIKYL